MKTNHRTITACAAIALAVGMVAGCGDNQDSQYNEIAVSAEVVEADAPAGVEVTQPVGSESDYLTHVVRITWMGADPVRLSDARFTHQVRDGNGTLVTAGRGCSPDLDAQREDVQIACTADFQLIDLQPGDTHEYSIKVYPSVGDLELKPGAYMAEETIQWNALDAPGGSPTSGDSGEFTIRLAYKVR